MAFRQVLGVVIVVTVASFCVALGHRTPANDLPPVVIVPGDGGSQLEARIQRKGLGNGGCDVDEDWFRLWLNVLELRPGNHQNRTAAGSDSLYKHGTNTARGDISPLQCNTAFASDRMAIEIMCNNRVH